MKRILVMRHAKSDWSTSLPDHERPLNHRGVKSAEAIGAALTRMQQAPDLVFTSSAVRARTTVELAAAAGDWSANVVVKPELYHTSSFGALEVAMEADASANSLLLAGHQPTWGSLVYDLTGAAVQMKTATVVAIDLLISAWDAATRARGEIAFVLQPRLFTEGDWGNLGEPE